jgi:hypothetical protein
VHGGARVFDGHLNRADVLRDGRFLVVAAGRERQARKLGENGSGQKKEE